MGIFKYVFISILKAGNALVAPLVLGSAHTGSSGETYVRLPCVIHKKKLKYPKTKYIHIHLQLISGWPRLLERTVKIYTKVKVKV